jgi:hypothetical protein
MLQTLHFCIVFALMQKEPARASVDSGLHLADSRLDWNVVQHAVLMAVGNKTAIKEVASKGRTEKAEYDQHPVGLWIVNCSFSSNSLVRDAQLHPATAAGRGAKDAVAGPPEAAAARDAAIAAAAGRAELQLRAMQDTDIRDSNSMQLLPLPPQDVAEGTFEAAKNASECHHIMEGMLERLQRGFPSKQHEAVLWANVGRFLLEEVSMNENIGFPFVLRVDNGMQYYKDLRFEGNHVYLSVLDTWYADVAMDGGRFLGNKASGGPLLQVQQSRFSSRKVWQIGAILMQDYATQLCLCSCHSSYQH